MKACSTKGKAKAKAPACSTKGKGKAKVAASALGEDGWMLKPCSNKRKAKAEAAVDEEGPMMKACSTKGKAKAAAAATGKEGCTTERNMEEEAAAAAALSSGVSEGGKHADAVEVAAAGGGLAPAGNGMWIMPHKEVQFILTREKDRIAPYLRESFLKHQAWVRSQYDANNGVVLLNDEMAMRRAEHRKAVQEEFADILDGLDLSGGIPISQWKFSDRDSDFFESDEEEEEGEVVHGPTTN